MSADPKPEKPPSEGTVACIVCKEPIAREAQMCTHCNSWQDWGRHLARWSASITAALAIVPLWTGAISLYNIAFRRAADVKIQALACESSFVSVAVTNSGGRAGILGNSSLSLQVNDTSVGKPFALQADKEHAVVRPQETFVLKLQTRVEGVATNIPVPNNVKSCTYRIITVVREFEGSSRESSVSCFCPGFGATH